MPVVRRIGERIFGVEAYWEDLNEFSSNSGYGTTNNSK